MFQSQHFWEVFGHFLLTLNGNTEWMKVSAHTRVSFISLPHFPLRTQPPPTKRSPNHFPESTQPMLPSEPEWGRTGKTKAKGKPHFPSSERYLFRLQPRRDPGVLLQGAARVVVRGRVPLEVKHEFADRLLHLQGHHRHHVLLLRALAVQADLPASSKGGRWGEGQNPHFFSIGLPVPSPWIPNYINTFLGNCSLAKASKGAEHSMPDSVDGTQRACADTVEGQRPPRKHAKDV